MNPLKRPPTKLQRASHPAKISSPYVSAAIEKAKNTDGSAKPDVKDVFILDAASGRIVSGAEVGTNTFGTIFVGKRQFATDVDSGSLREVDIKTGKIKQSLAFAITDPQNPGKSISLEPHQPGVGTDGKLYVPLFNAEHGHSIAIVDTKQGLRQVGVMDFGKGRQPHVVSISPDGKTLYVTVQNTKPAVVQVDLTSPMLKRTEIAVPSVPRVIQATNKGAFFTAFGVEGILHTPKGEAKAQLIYKDSLPFNGRTDPFKLFEGIDANADGSMLAATRDDGSNRVVVLKKVSSGAYEPKVYTVDSKPYFVKLNGDLAHVTMQQTGKILTIDTRVSPNRSPHEFIAWNSTLVKGRPVKRAAVGGTEADGVK